MQGAGSWGHTCSVTSWRLAPRGPSQPASAVFSLQNREGLAQGLLGGHQNQVSGREFGAEDGQELSMEAWEEEGCSEGER